MRYFNSDDNFMAAGDLFVRTMRVSTGVGLRFQGYCHPLFFSLLNLFSLGLGRFELNFRFPPRAYSRWGQLLRWWQLTFDTGMSFN